MMIAMSLLYVFIYTEVFQVTFNTDSGSAPVNNKHFPVWSGRRNSLTQDMKLKLKHTQYLFQFQ